MFVHGGGRDFYMIHNHLVIKQEMRCLSNFFFSFSFPEEVKHVFHGLQPARGLVLFIVLICGLGMCALPESSAAADHSCRS